MPRAKDAELESAFHTWKDEDRRVCIVTPHLSTFIKANNKYSFLS